MNVLLTGGTGYIGSHVCVELLKAGHNVVVVDNLCNSQALILDRIERIIGRKPIFFQVDVRDDKALNAVFAAQHIDAVLHLAGLKAIGESMRNPLLYYDNNLDGTVTLCQAMVAHGVFNLIFSSSATVYGSSASLPIREDHPLSVTNPYGRSKLFIESLLQDVQQSNPRWNVALLRYFNPVGAHESGLIGENLQEIPNNLMPYVAQVAAGRLAELLVYGNDYPTPDGTGVRDYIHVMDLAQGHRYALDQIQRNPGLVVYNLGTGRGWSVLEVVAAFERVSGRKIPYRIVQRRHGDVAICYADPSLAKKELGWEAVRGMEQMCQDAWRWECMQATCL